jgi:hypothetical protein
MRTRGVLIAAVGAAWVLLAVPQIAIGAIRYAAPADTGLGDCSSRSNACDLQQAVSDAGAADEVIVGGSAGTYNLGTAGLSTSKALDIHGAAGEPLPWINSSAPAGGVGITNPGARVARMRIEYSGTEAGLVMANGVAEQLIVHSTASNSYACELTFAGTLRDSVCAMDQIGVTGGVGVRAQRSTGGGTETLRNLTAIGSTGIEAWTTGGGVALTVDAKNVIAGGVTDVRALTSGGSATTVLLSHSNYGTRSPSSPGGGAFVTSPSDSGNQTAPAYFTDPISGTFHQAAGSPTIDAGVGNLVNGSADIDGDKRALDGNDDCVVRADIGADEFVGPTPPDCSSGPPSARGPDTIIDKGPKRKTKKRKAKFRFSSNDSEATFECKLDKKDFEPCTSPKKYKKLKRRKHKFRVRATDAAGNVDQTPDSLKWTVKRKH